MVETTKASASPKVDKPIVEREAVLKSYTKEEVAKVSKSLHIEDGGCHGWGSDCCFVGRWEGEGLHRESVILYRSNADIQCPAVLFVFLNDRLDPNSLTASSNCLDAFVATVQLVAQQRRRSRTSHTHLPPPTPSYPPVPILTLTRPRPFP